MPLTLENIFYLLAIIVLVFSLIFMIAIGVGLWLAFKKVKDLESQVRLRFSTLKTDNHGLSLASLRSVSPLLLSAAMGLGYKVLKNKFFKR